MFELYPHQKKIIHEAYTNLKNGHRCQVIAAATGVGKTVIASKIACDAVKKGKKVLFVVHLTSLVLQAIETFSKMGLSVGVLQGENTRFHHSDDIIVASIQTIAARGAPDWCGVVIIDECHVEHKAHRELIDKWSLIPFIGLSATPLRIGLGERYTKLVKGPSIRWLVENGYLTPVTVYAPQMQAIESKLADVDCGNTTNGWDYKENQLGAAMNNKELRGDVIKNWMEYCENRQTLAYATTIAHSKDLVADFCDAGIEARHVGSDTPTKEALRIVDEFRDGRVKILCSVFKTATGFDVPDASAIIMARPTKSTMLAMQTMGRGIRPAEGKEDCIIMDHANIFLEHDVPIDFELPDELLKGDAERTQKQVQSDEEKCKKKDSFCKNCQKLLEPHENPCSRCGEPRRVKCEVTYTSEQMTKIGEDAAKDRISVKDRRDWYLGFVWTMLEKGKPEDKAFGFAYHQSIKAFPGTKPKWNWRYLKPKPPSIEQDRWSRNQYRRWKKLQSLK